MQRSSGYRRGFSLVEVVASIFLVGTLLAGVLLAHRRAAAQLRTADRRLDAIAVLEDLLAARRQAENEELQLARGKASGDNPYHWRTSLRDDPAVAPLAAAVLRIELYDPALDTGVTLAAVELLVPGGTMSTEAGR